MAHRMHRHEQSIPEDSAQHIHHDHHHSSDAASFSTRRSSTTRLSIDESLSASPVRVHHDYDLKHNLNSSDNLPAFASNNASTSMLSPMSATFGSPVSAAGSDETWTPATPKRDTFDNGFLNVTPAQHSPRNPFNFTPQEYVATTRAAHSSQENIPGKRRGHKYKHSSTHATHQIFQPPIPKAPLAVPASLPIPTRKEAWGSLSHNQNLRLMWSFAHLVVAGSIQFIASGSLALTALSRLMLFDAAGAISCVAVDVMTNFEVWNRSTIRHPFGLARADVLAGFGMAVFIAFMGLDIISHGTQHALENLGDHEAHSPHSHARPSGSAIIFAAIIAAATTLVSALALGNHARMGRAMQVPWLARWGNVLGNASHFLTLSCCVLLLGLPLLNSHVYHVVDPLMAFGIAGTMITFGVRLGGRLGNILLMAYNQPTDKHAIRKLINEIESDNAISAVEDAQIWQVNYGLGLADLKVRYRASGYADEVSKLRRRIIGLVRSHLGGVYGEGKGLRWDVSIQVALEKD